jgi:cell division protein FtsA
MKYFGKRNIFTIIDIGTTKIITIIAEKKNNTITILGIGNNPSTGLTKGIITNIKEASRSIEESINQATLQAKTKAKNISIGISGKHIKSYFITSKVKIHNKQQEITQEILDQGKQNALQFINTHHNEAVLHIIPLSYMIDGELHTENPLNRHGSELIVKYYIITGNKNCIEDLLYSCQKSNLQIENIILEPIASAQAILNTEEKYFGAVIVDIGGGTTDIAIYQNGKLQGTHIIPFGGECFTNDLTFCLGCTRNEAEKLKREQGLKKYHMTNIDEDYTKILSINCKKEIQISRKLIYDILLARTEDLTKEIKKYLESYTHNEKFTFPSGIILTGGGSLLKEIDTIIENRLNLPCHIGFPKSDNEEMQSPIYTTSYGLLLNQIDLSEKKFSEKSFFQKLLTSLPFYQE